MSDFDRYTRVNKFEKRRKNTKLLSLLIVAGSVLIVLLIGLWIFGPDDEQEQPDNVASSNEDPIENEDQNKEAETEETESGQEATESDENSSEVEEDQNDDSESSNNDTSEGIESEVGEKEQVEPTGDDDNVIEAYTQNWQPVGTEQEGPHTVVYDEGSQDRIEMEKALRYATGLAEGDMITWWLQRGGEQKVIGTVSDKAETQTYRVYISWIDNQGWQPTLVEVLKENDQKYRFE